MVLDIIGRSQPLFETDMTMHENELNEIIANSSFLVIGAAGTIGQAVTVELFKRNPKLLHAVDINENNLVELVRSLRSEVGYKSGEFRTFSIDSGSPEFLSMVNYHGPYDFAFNLSALKHVRSEKDPFTLMRLIRVNIFNIVNALNLTKSPRLQNYFCVSTDKAANPVNMMGASKRIMEMFLMHESATQKIGMARFANVAFSDGSLLHGFSQRFSKKQPISAPLDTQRYFITPKEAGELCILSGLLGENRDIFFPKLNSALHLQNFSQIAVNFIERHGYEPYQCSSESEARSRCNELISRGKWPVYFFNSDTTGEKAIEEFFTDNEIVDFSRFDSIGVVKNNLEFNVESLVDFQRRIEAMIQSQSWTKRELVEEFYKLIPDFAHHETGKHLDDRM
jgi:FlaA1/EpsC-like NDP-sugar epimerase